MRMSRFSSLGGIGPGGRTSHQELPEMKHKPIPKEPTHVLGVCSCWFSFRLFKCSFFGLHVFFWGGP